MAKKKVEVERKFVNVKVDEKSGHIKIECEYDVLPVELVEELVNQVHEITIKSVINSDARKMTEKLLFNKGETTFFKVATCVLSLLLIIAALKIRGAI